MLQILRDGLMVIFSIFTFLSAIAQKKPEPLAPGVISTGQDYCTTLTPDGKTLYFVRSIDDSRDEILFSTRTDRSWSEPRPVSFTGKFSDTDPVLSPDGGSLYFMTNRNFDQNGSKQDYDLWVTNWDSEGWSDPYRLPDFINTSFTEGFPSTASNGNLYFFRANKPGHSEQDIWFAPKIGGGFGVPEKLGANINTASWDGHPFIAPDESFIIFYSNRPGGSGSCDLYISFKENNSWGLAKNLGDLINTEACEMVPFLTTDTKTLYFSRIENGKRNIYHISFDAILEKLERSATN